MREKILINVKNYLIYILNSYLIIAILLLFLKPMEENYFQLDNHFNVGLMFFLLSIISGLLYLVDTKLKKVNQVEMLIVLLIGYFLFNVLYTNSVLINIGFTLFLFAMTAFLYLNKISLRHLATLSLLLALIKVLILFSMSNFQNLDKFAFDSAEVNFSRFVIFIISLVVAFLVYGLVQYILNTGLASFIQTNKRMITVILLLVIAAYTFFVILLMVSRIKSFSSPNYDMGIFSQVLANMGKGLGPVSTLERDMELSHFSVHVSPILYLILPFYYLWPGPEIINVAQVIITISGIIPLYLILKQHKFSSIVVGLFILLYLFFPTLTTSHFYDFHENCFLSPLLLWLILANIKGWKKLGLIFTLLTLFVKEDAMIYVISIYLFFIFQDRYPVYHRNKIYYTCIQLILPTIYFIACMYWLNTYGVGAMTTRFTNLMLPGQVSLLNVVINALVNPTFVISSIFIQRKLSYILLLFSCIAFMPLMQKRWTHYFLMIPLFVINLFSDYFYQVDFTKQYNYGSTVLLIFMSILAYEEISKGVRSSKIVKQASFERILPLVGLITSFFILGSFITPRLNTLTEYMDQKDTFQQVEVNLKKIPRDAKVLTYTFYTPHLSDVYYLYDVFYHNEGVVNPEIDYVVVPRNILDNHEMKETQIVNNYYHMNYQESKLSSETVLVLEKSH